MKTFKDILSIPPTPAASAECSQWCSLWDQPNLWETTWYQSKNWSWCDNLTSHIVSPLICWSHPKGRYPRTDCKESERIGIRIECTVVWLRWSNMTTYRNEQQISKLMKQLLTNVELLISVSPWRLHLSDIGWDIRTSEIVRAALWPNYAERRIRSFPS